MAICYATCHLVLARHYVDKVPGAINDTLSLGLMARYYPYFC